MSIKQDEDFLCKKIDKLIKKIDLLQRKKELWGLDEEDAALLIKHECKYLQYNYQLIDITFSKYIEPFLYNDRVIEIKSTLWDKYQWEGQILYFDKDIQELVKNINDSKENIINLLTNLKEEEMKMAEEFLNTNHGKEMGSLFSVLTKNTEDDCIKDYINVRHEVMINFIEGDKFE